MEREGAHVQSGPSAQAVLRTLLEHHPGTGQNELGWEQVLSCFVVTVSPRRGGLRQTPLTAPLAGRPRPWRRGVH